jgi:hypothetical protein
MRLRRPTILPLVAWTVAFSAVAATSRADSVAPPFSYTKPSPDGRFLFVMIPPGTVEDDTRRWNEQKAAEIRAIHNTYPQSGLYRNDGTTTPLWTVSWYAYDVEVASDGVHLVRHGPWAFRSDEEAVSFFANGKLVRTYVISELVDLKFLLPHSVSHFQWSEGGHLDDAALRYVVSTKDGNSFVFDVTNGNIVKETRNARLKLWAALIAVAVFAAALTAIVVRRKRMRSAGHPAAT